MTTTTITAKQVKQGDRIVYDRGAGIDNPRVERVVRVTAGPRGYVHIRTDHCDRTVKVATPIQRQDPRPHLTGEAAELAAGDMADAHAHGLHDDGPREGCPVCDETRNSTGTTGPIRRGL